MPKNPVEIALHARDLVLDGHCKHRFEDSNGNVCIEGAISKAIFGVASRYARVSRSDPDWHTYYQVIQAAEKVLPEDILASKPFNNVSLPWFNDLPATTKHMAAAILDDAAKLLKEQADA